MGTLCKIQYMGKAPADNAKEGSGIYTINDANGDPCSFDPGGVYAAKIVLLSDEQIADIEAGKAPFQMFVKNCDSQGREQKLEQTEIVKE